MRTTPVCLVENAAGADMAEVVAEVAVATVNNFALEQAAQGAAELGCLVVVAGITAENEVAFADGMMATLAAVEQPLFSCYQ